MWIPKEHTVARAVMAAVAAATLAACGTGTEPSSSLRPHHCADVMAAALTTPDHVVTGTFACMSPDQQNYWHRWAVSRDEQLADVVRNHGLSGAGLVYGYDPRALWDSARYETTLEWDRHLYLVHSTEQPTAYALLVIETDEKGKVAGFYLKMMS